MALSIGIVGLPNVGKSTLFNVLTQNKSAEASNYPFCTIDPNVGIVKVPDERLEKIASISNPTKIIPTTIEFVDIAGLVSGASKGEGLGNKFLSHIRECDAICEVVREFKDGNIIHVNGKIDPDGDKETINLELILADLATVTKSLDKVAKDAKSGNKESVALRDLLTRVKEGLENEKAVRDIDMSTEEKLSIKSLSLLTAKPIVYALNTKDISKDLTELKAKWGDDIIALDAKMEEEIASMDPGDQKEYIEELGLDSSGLDKLIKASYKLLGLSTYFTTGKEETRAWTYKNGFKAPQAAGVIHTDFEKGFIRAEIIKYNDFIENNGEANCREKGLIKTEGKDYVMQDGDICHFLFN
ncbi:redox-regulated ATPase YchF [Candidatus Parcubacteria bacterium]|nr:MAG: redox-regulated ATPase YchF [Candidatus Parcubacteria bacterium]